MLSLVCLSVTQSYAEEAPAPAPLPAPNPEQAPAGDGGAPAGEKPTQPAPAIRFLDAFPGSPADRAELVRLWNEANANQPGQEAPRRNRVATLEQFAPDPLETWLRGPVPSQITPNLLLLTWQRVLGEHRQEVLLTFVPRLRQYALRVLTRIGARLDGLKDAAAAGDATKIAEQQQLTALAYVFRDVVRDCLGVADPDAGLPAWVAALPVRFDIAMQRRWYPVPDWMAHRYLNVERELADAQQTNLVVEGLTRALYTLQRELVLEGGDRFTDGPRLFGLLFEERADVQLVSDLNRCIDQFTPDLPLGNDFLTQAAVAQLPTDPKGVAVWKESIAKAQAARLARLRAAGCLAPAPAAGEHGDMDLDTWTFFSVRLSPMDGSGSFRYSSPPKPMAELFAQSTPWPQLTPARWESLRGGEDLTATQAPEAPCSQQYAVRAVLGLPAAARAERLCAYFELTPKAWTGKTNVQNPLQNESLVGPVWVEGSPAFYDNLALAANALAAYWHSFGLSADEARELATICGDLSQVCANGCDTPSVELLAQRATRLAHAREWIYGCLATGAPAGLHPLTVWGSYGRESNALSFGLGRDNTLRIELYPAYAVRPWSISGLETVEPEERERPLLTVSLAPRAERPLEPIWESTWQAADLAQAVLGPKGEGPIRAVPWLFSWDTSFRPENDRMRAAWRAPLRHRLLAWALRDPTGFAAAVQPDPTLGARDVELLLEWVARYAPTEDLPLIRELLAKAPEYANALLCGLTQSQSPAAMDLILEVALAKPTPLSAKWLACLPVTEAARAHRNAYLKWLAGVPEPQAYLAALGYQPHPAQAAALLPWYDRATDPDVRALILAQFGGMFGPEPFVVRARYALQAPPETDLNFNGGGDEAAIHSVLTADEEKQVLARLTTALADPAVRAQALAGLALSDRAEAYAALAQFWADPQHANLPFDPAFIALLGTSVVNGPRPELGRELLRAWVKQPVLTANGKPRAGTMEENQAWALAVDLLDREYIVGDDLVPAIVDRYRAEVGADLTAARLRFPTHAAFAEAFFVNRELVLDRLAAGLAATDPAERDAVLAILTTQTRVDALNGARPAELPALENLPLRLEGVAEAARKAQAEAWKGWLKARRAAILEEMYRHLE